MSSLASLGITVASYLLTVRAWENCVNVREIASRLSLSTHPVLEALKLLQDTVAIHDDCVLVRDPLDLAIAAIRLGASEKTIAERLDWRMFENYAAKALEAAGYQVYRDLKLYSPFRFQVDVLGIQANHGVVFECKHWNPYTSTPSRLKTVAEQHVERISKLVKVWGRLGLPRPPRGVIRLVPSILVLREYTPLIVNGVLIVPVSRLRGFLEELPSLAYIEGVKVFTVE